AIRPIEATRFHHAARLCGCRLATRGARALVRVSRDFDKDVDKLVLKRVQLLVPDREEAMKKILASLLLSCWCGCALAQTAQELIDNGKDSENVTTFGMGYHPNQNSPLTQINKSNVKRLVPIWSTSLSNDAGELAQPTIYNGVMYVVN